MQNQEKIEEIQEEYRENNASRLKRGLDVFGELFVLNLIFILFSLPVITIGASLTALYSVTGKLVRREDVPVWSGFIKAFRENFKKATILWIFVFLYAVVLVSQYLLIINVSGVVSTIYMVIFFITLALGFLVLPYLFALTARYENTIRNTLKNALLLGISHLGTSLKISCLWFGSVMISVIYPKIFLFTWYLWLLLFFALFAYITSGMLRKVFEKVE